MELNHLENIQICTAYQGTQILSMVENFLNFYHYNMHFSFFKSIDAIKQSLVTRFRFVLMLSKWCYSMFLFSCFKLSINLIPIITFMRFENWRNKFFLFKFLYKFLFLNKFSWWHPCLSILSLIKLVSSSENWGDLTLCCILGASTNSILSPEIIEKMFGSFVSFLHCLTCFSSWPPKI